MVYGTYPGPKRVHEHFVAVCQVDETSCIEHQLPVVEENVFRPCSAFQQASHGVGRRRCPTRNFKLCSNARDICSCISELQSRRRYILFCHSVAIFAERNALRHGESSFGRRAKQLSFLISFLRARSHGVRQSPWLQSCSTMVAKFVFCRTTRAHVYI